MSKSKNKPSKEELSKVMSYLGKRSSKKNPLTTEKAKELVNKRWKKGVDKSVA